MANEYAVLDKQSSQYIRNLLALFAIPKMKEYSVLFSSHGISNMPTWQLKTKITCDDHCHWSIRRQ